MKEETKWLTGYVLSSWLSNFGQGLVVTVLGNYYALYVIIHSNLVASGILRPFLKLTPCPVMPKWEKAYLLFGCRKLPTLLLLKSKWGQIPTTPICGLNLLDPFETI